MIIWTEAQSPFIFGGDVAAPVGANVEVGDAVGIGAWFLAYEIVSPVDGSMHIAESRTGALIGTSIEEVRADVAAGDIEFMREQVSLAEQRKKKVRLVESDVFWATLAKSGGEES